MASTGASGRILLQRLLATSPAISWVECCSGLGIRWPRRLSTRSMSACVPVRKIQFGSSAPCLAAKALSTSGVSLAGSLVSETKVTCPAASPRAARTSLSLRVISGQASLQWVKITLSNTTRSLSTSL
ncbi:hypothetical protein D9M68_325860 [compost metagenome]